MIEQCYLTGIEKVSVYEKISKTNEKVAWKKLKRVKQAGFLIEKVEDIALVESDSLETTDRGERGFGSMGRWENVIAYEDYLENISYNIRKLCAEKKVTLSLWYLLLYWEAKMVLSLERLQL